MTKAELRDALIAKGFTVATLETWTEFDKTNPLKNFGINEKRYDVMATKGAWKGKGQVVVYNEGTEDENAVGYGHFTDTAESFESKLETFIRAKETGSVYAVVKREVSESDKVAAVEVYILANDTITKHNYIVRERAGVFDYKKIA